MTMKYKTECMACGKTLHPGDEGHGAKVAGKWSFLCAECWAKCERGGRTPRNVIEAILLSFDPDFGGPADPCDHEDYRDLERLGLWPT